MLFNTSRKAKEATPTEKSMPTWRNRCCVSYPFFNSDPLSERFQLATARRNYDSLNEEYDIIMMEPKEAHAKFVARVNEHKQVHYLLCPFQKLDQLNLRAECKVNGQPSDIA